MEYSKLTKKKVTIIAHYFAPINSTGAHRPESLARYLVGKKFDVSILSTKKMTNSETVFDNTNILV